MAKNTTGSGTSVDGSTFVHTGNMGKSLVFDGKVYNVKVGDTLTIGEDGLVDVKLSSESGNLLQKRSDGLYYGVTPPANRSLFFVDAVNGIDQNPDEVVGAGSQDMPFKTLPYAISQHQAGTNVGILLREDQDHVVNVQEMQTKLGRISISIYGDYFSYLVAQGQDSWEAGRKILSEGKAPRVIFQNSFANKYVRGISLGRLTNFVVGHGSLMRIEHCELINDLSFTYKRHASATKPTVINNRSSRILINDGGSLVLFSSILKTRGRSSVSDDVELTLPLRTTYKDKELDNCGMFWCGAGSLELSYTKVDETEYNAFVIGGQGSDRNTGSDTFFVLSTLRDTTFETLNKYVGGIVTETTNGVVQAIRPNIDVPAKHFT